MQKKLHSGRTMFVYFLIISVKILLLITYLPFVEDVSGNEDSHWIYEESVKRFINEDTYYLEVAPGQDAVELFDELKNQGLVSEYSQPFSGLDIPYYRVEFASNEDITKRTIASMTQSFKIQSNKGNAPVFEVQQFSHKGSVTRPLNKLSRRPKLFSTQAITEPNFEWQWYTDEIGLIPSQLSCVKMNRPKIKIAVIDNAFMTTHPNIAGSITYALDVADGDKSTLPPNFEAEWMHGSHSAGLIAGKKNKGEGIVGTSLGSADLYVFKATADSAGPTEITHGIEAVAKAIEMDVDIISLSWGAYMDFPVFREVIKKATNKGIVIIAAAGNYGSEDPFFPAYYDGVISIGAYDKNMKRADFSNYGDRVDIFAPGVDLVVPVNKDEYASTDGTSSAAPLFAGVYSFLSRYLGDNHKDFNKVLTKNNSDLGKYLSLSKLCNSEGNNKPTKSQTNTIQQVEEDIPIAPTHEAPEEQGMREKIIDLLKVWGGWIVALIALFVSGYVFFFRKNKLNEKN